MATAQAEDVYLADSPPSVVQLQVAKHFDALDDKQKRYAHFISKAAFAGTRIVLRQVSPESEPIYDLIVALHRATSGDWTALGQKAGVDASEVRLFTEYAAMFLGNTGNYKSFGDAKFLPRCSAESVRKLAQVSPDATKAWEQCKDALFSFQPSGMMHLGHLEDGHLSTYYPDSPSITKDEIDAVKDWAEKVGLLPENNRLVKTDAGDFRILIASAIASAPAEGDTGKEAEFTLEKGPLKGKKITLVYGDHAREMAAITGYIKKAAENAANDAQRDMHLAYAKSFETGSMLAFKDSQRHWIKDKGPMIECNIGFIETYRDPAGIRGEWEGFASSEWVWGCIVWGGGVCVFANMRCSCQQ
jgi:dipeptidyl-peptidase-3